MTARRAAPVSTLAPVMATATLVGMTVSLTLPLLSLVLERQGASAFAIGLNSAAGGLGIFVIAPFLGRLLARLGPVGCMGLALAVLSACMLLFPLWIAPGFWAALRVLFGSAAALLFVLSEAAVNALAPEERRGRVLGLYATLFSLGFAAGPLILALVGSEGRLPFVLAAGLFALGLVPTALLRPVAGRLLPEGEGTGHRLLDTWRVAPRAMAGVLAYALLETSTFALLPVFALNAGLGERAVAALLSVWLSGNILLQYPIGWLADRWPRARIMALAALVATLLQLLVPLAVGTALLWPVLVLLGGTMGGLYTLSLALVGERFQGADLARANTAFVMTFQLGAIAGPSLTGAVMGVAGTASFPFVLAGIAAVLATAMLLSGPGTPRPRAIAPSERGC